MALTICVKWSGKEYEVLAEPSDTVEQLKVTVRRPSSTTNSSPGEDHGEDWCEAGEAEAPQPQGEALVEHE